jgi:hypothetical protein
MPTPDNHYSKNEVVEASITSFTDDESPRLRVIDRRGSEYSSVKPPSAIRHGSVCSHDALPSRQFVRGRMQQQRMSSVTFIPRRRVRDTNKTSSARRQLCHLTVRGRSGVESDRARHSSASRLPSSHQAQQLRTHQASSASRFFRHREPRISTIRDTVQVPGQTG